MARLAFSRPKLGIKALLALAVAVGGGIFLVRAINESRPAARWARQLRRGDAGARRLAAAELRKVEPRDATTAVEALIGGLADADAEVRARSALSLGSLLGRSGGLNAPRVAKAARSSTADDDPPRRRAATALIAALADASPLVRALAAKSLGGFDPAPAAAIGPLIVLLKGDADEGARVAAAGALAVEEVGDRGPVDALIAASTGDASPAVRLAAATALAPIAGFEPAFNALIGRLDSADPRIRAAAEEGLRRVRLPHPSGLPALLALLDRADLPEPTTDLVAWLIGGIGPEAARAAPSLLAASRRLKESPDQDLALRATVDRALYSVAPESPEFRAALDELIVILGQTPPTWRQYSSAVLLGEFGKLAEPALPELRKAALEWEKDYTGYAGKAITAIELAIEGVEP